MNRKKAGKLLLACHKAIGLTSTQRIDYKTLLEIDERVKQDALIFQRLSTKTHYYPNVMNPAELLTRREVYKTFRPHTDRLKKYGWGWNYELKRSCLAMQGRNLYNHVNKNGIDLIELAPACNPKLHLMCCVSGKLISYEIVPAFYKKQIRDRPYLGFSCREHQFNFGNLIVAVLDQKHPEATFLNNDTMGSMSKDRQGSYSTVISAFLGDGSTPKYFRGVMITGGKTTHMHGIHDTLTTQKLHDAVTRELQLKPIEPWYTYKTQGSALEITTRTYFYKPTEKMKTWLSMSRHIIAQIRIRG